MLKKKVLSVALMLLLGIFCHSQSVDFSVFAGRWQTADAAHGFDILYTSDGKPQFGAYIANNIQYTNNIAHIDSTLYIDFTFPPKGTLGCDTLYSHLLFVARLTANGTLEVHRKQIDELQSPIFGEDFKFVLDTVYVLFKKMSYLKNQQTVQAKPVKEQLDYDSVSLYYYYIAVSYYNRLVEFLKINPDFNTQNLDANDFEQVRIYRNFLQGSKVDFNEALWGATRSKCVKENSDNEIIAGSSAYYLMILEDALAKKRQYAELVLQYLPDAFVAERMFANGWKVMCDYRLSRCYRDFFHAFTEICAFVNGCDSMDAEVINDPAIKDLYLQLVLCRNRFFSSYFHDTSFCLADMHRFDDVDSNNVWKREMYVLLCQEYGKLGSDADTAFSKNQPLGFNFIARRFYEKSLEYFDSAKIEMVTKENVEEFRPVYFACERLGIGRSLLEGWYDTLGARYCQYPDILSHLTSYEAETAMIFLLNNGRTDEALDFYDRIKGNFRFDGAVNNNYFIALVRKGFAGDEVSNAIRLSNSIKRQKGEENSLADSIFQENLILSAQLNFENGDIWAAYDDLLKIKTDTIGISILRLVMMGKKDGNKAAYDECWRLLDNNMIEDSLRSTVLYYRGWYAEQLAKETQDSIRQANLLVMARADYEEAIAIEDSLNVPYVYFQMGQQEKALRLAEQKLLRDGGTSEDYLSAADLYCMAGDLKTAKKYVKKSFELSHDFFDRVWAEMFDPHLEPIRDYVSDIVAIYAKEDASVNSYKRLSFDTLRTVIPFVVSETGSIYVSCEINGLEFEEEAKIDNGADWVQVPKRLLCDMVYSDSISVNDYRGEITINTADGSNHKMKCVMLRTLKLGDIVLHNVMAVVSENDEAPLLLGQSVLANFIMEINPFKAQITLTKIDEKR